MTIQIISVKNNCFLTWPLVINPDKIIGLTGARVACGFFLHHCCTNLSTADLGISLILGTGLMNHLSGLVTKWITEQNYMYCFH